MKRLPTSCRRSSSEVRFVAGHLYSKPRHTQSQSGTGTDVQSGHWAEGLGLRSVLGRRDRAGTGTAVPGISRDWPGTGTAVPPSLEGLGLQSQATHKVLTKILTIYWH